ncbi:MAG: phage tail protein I, partial [Anaerolineales bacterium]|nr:phage tail protein I [Anaerolineales bacterium]
MSEQKKPSDQEHRDQLAAFPQDYGWLSLRRKSGQEAKRRLNQPVYRIGREIGNDLVLPDPIISRYHARILCTSEGCLIEDLGSQNRTRLNDELLPPNEPQPLIDGDSIRIADYILVYHVPEPLGELDEEEFVLTFAEAPPPEAPVVSVSWPLPPRSSYQNYLPSFFTKDFLLDRFLLIFESIMGPINQLVDHMPLVLDPQTVPADLLPWSASWLDLTLNENWPEKHRRDLIRAASELYRWRGTRYGLSRYLEIYAGVTPEIDDNLAQAHTFRVTLRVPIGQPVDESLVREIIENEKPAHTFYELLIEEYKPEKKPAPPARPNADKIAAVKPARKDEKESPEVESAAKEKPAPKKKPEKEK